MTISKAQQKASAKYSKSHYDRINLVLPIGYRDKLKEIAASQGESVNGYIKAAIDKRMEQDTKDNE